MTPSVIERLKLRAAQWNVALVESRETEGSLLGFGTCNGDRVVLKITKTIGDEWHSGEVLRAFRGAGTVRVLESAEGAVLLERLDPATELVELVRAGRDEEATAVLAELLSSMAHHDAPARCPTVTDWGLGFDRYVNNGEIPAELVHQAAEIYGRLAASQKQVMLLHGDLHHYNALFDANRGWVAIDPKGVVGELEYELGAMIRNPVELPEFYISRTVVERRLKQLTGALSLDYDRALGWAFAQAVLSAIWGVEDGFTVTPTHPQLRLAKLISP
ncbi:MAG TPA: aminoglycoside phosphotransferase family protein [Pyrinomonadaceae bacterium]|nr:aminoglycoside phosphotransferase family protein [Pyrinomonadaceae bacterium]